MTNVVTKVVTKLTLRSVRLNCRRAAGGLNESPALEVLHDEILGRAESWIHEGRTGRGGASIQVAVQPESVSSAVGRTIGDDERVGRESEGLVDHC